MVQLRQKQSPFSYYVDSNLRFKFNSTGVRTLEVQFATKEQDGSTCKENECDSSKNDIVLEKRPLKSGEPTSSDVDSDFLRYRQLPKEEFHQKMEKLEKRQLSRLRSSLSVSVSQKREEQLPYCFTKAEKVTFKDTKQAKRERILRRKKLKSPFITRLPRLTLSVTPLAFGYEIPPMQSTEFDISCLLDGSSR
jgi:hypothetical protein